MKFTTNTSAVFLLFQLFILNGYSQVPVIAWDNTIGGTMDESFCDVIQTSDGGYLVGGMSQSNVSGDKTENNMGIFYDYWILKLDIDGVIQWQNTIGGTDDDRVTGILETFDGGFLVSGMSISNAGGDKTENSYGIYDYWIVKINSSGNILWQNDIGGDESDELWAVIQTTDHGFLLAGGSHSGISGDKTDPNKGDLDYWIVKTDSLGSIQWQKTIGGNQYDQLSAVIQMADGGYMLCGISTSGISGDKTEPSLGNSDYWIIKTDASGNIQWQNTIGGSDSESMNSAVETPNGGCIVAGFSRSNSSVDKAEMCMGMMDYWIVKIDSSGNIVWENTIGGFESDAAYSIRSTSDGGYLVAGFSNSSISGDKTSGNMEDDYWIVKLDSSGNVQWDKTIGGNYDDNLFSMEITSDGGCVMSGSSTSDLSGDKTEGNFGIGDFWIVKLGNVTNVAPTPDIAVSIYPNPANNLLKIQTGSRISGISITDLMGRQLIYFQTDETIAKQTLDISGLADGCYLIQCDSGNMQIRSKFVKAHY